jgi:hypothetical protein
MQANAHPDPVRHQHAYSCRGTLATLHPLSFCWQSQIRDTVRLNNDPRQEQLARLLVAVGRGAPMYKITRFLSQQTDWSLDEDWKRVTHALTIVEKLVEPAIYEKARDVGLIVIEASRGGRHKWR